MTVPPSKPGPRQGPPEGATPTHQSDQQNERIRREGEADSSGGGAERPDAKDEAFIESTKGPAKPE